MVGVFRLHFQTAITFFADLLFASITESGREFDSPHKAAVLFSPKIVVRHFEIKSEVTEDAQVLEFNCRSEDRIAFLCKAGANPEVRKKIIGQGKAHFEVATLAIFRIVDEVQNGEFGFEFEETVESAIEQREVQIRRNLVSVIRFVDSRGKEVLHSNTDEQVTVL